MVGKVSTKFEKNWTSIFLEKYEEGVFLALSPSRSHTADYDLALPKLS